MGIISAHDLEHGSASRTRSTDQRHAHQNYVCPDPIIALTFVSKPSLRMGISGVWKGFFITASAYASYIRCRMCSAIVSFKDVNNTNFVPEMQLSKIQADNMRRTHL